MAIVDEVVKAPGKDFVKYFWEDVKALMVRGSGNKASRYLEVAAYAKCGRKGAIWLLEGREGRGWSRVVGELGKMLTFLGSKARMLGFWGVYIGGATEGGCFIKLSGWGFSILCVSGSGGSSFSRQAYWAAGFKVRAAWVGSAFGGVVKNTNPVYFLDRGEARKKKKLGLYRSWKELLEWLWAALDWVSASGFQCARLGLKPKWGN
jgi:hypothetical protein